LIFPLSKDDKKKVKYFLEEIIKGGEEKEELLIGLDKKLLALEIKYPELKVYREYFGKIKNRNDYMAIMKQGVINHIRHLRKFEKISYKAMGTILNSDHASAMRYYKECPLESHPAYNEIVLIMDKMIKQGLYPKAKINSRGYTSYSWETLKEINK